MANLSDKAACFGNKSDICMPMVRVDMALNGPRYSAGESGFGS